MRYKKIHSLSVIVPCYNEEDNFPRYQKELYPYLNDIVKKKKIKNYEIIIIDDGSSDGTYKLAKELFKKNTRVVRHPENRGLGAAVRTGIENAEKELTLVIDADLTFHPRYIESVVDAFIENNVDAVFGSPFMKGGGLEGVPWYRQILSRSVIGVYNLLLFRRITSITPIFKLYRTKDLKQMPLKSNGFDINAEIIFCLIQKNKEIKEIPVVLTTRVAGNSKINFRKEIKNHICMLIKILKWRLG